MTLPVPGSLPAKPAWQAVIIFVVILIVMGWLLAWGYSLDTAFETVTAAGVLASAIAVRLIAVRQA